MSDKSVNFANDPEAAKILIFIKDGRWRKARDAAKELCKRDRARYLDLLIQANVGLAREMLGKGLLKEAETVVAHLASFAPAETVALLRKEMAVPQGKRQLEALADSGGAGWWMAALRADEILMQQGNISPADQAAVDLLVTDSFEPDLAGGEERVAQLAAELKAVRNACAATGEGRWEEAKDSLRTLPRQSIFWQWRIFLRGVRCVFEEERETARQCFAQLPATGTLARAAAALAPDLARSTRPAPATAKIPLFLAATGQPAAWAAALLTATASWKAGKRIQAFDDLAAGMRPVFPSLEPGLPAMLTDGILPSTTRMSDDDWVDSEAMFARFGNQRKKAESHLQKAVLVFLRSMCAAEKSEMPEEELDRCWQVVIKLWHENHGPDPLRDSLAWKWLGDELARAPKPRFNIFGFAQTAPYQNAEKALKAYENATAADETNESAWLALASLLIKERDTKKSNPLLDKLIKKFPRNKAILVLAGESAIARKSHTKGSAALRAALALDPLDRDIKVQLVGSLLVRIREARTKASASTGLWAEIEPFLEDSPPRGYELLSRWMARVRRSLLDQDQAAASQAMAESIAMAPSDVIRLFLAATLVSVYQTKLYSGWPQDWKAACSSPQHTWKTQLAILRLADFLSAQPGWGVKQMDLIRKRAVEAVAHLVAPHNIKTDPTGLLELIDELLSLRKRTAQRSVHVIGMVMREIADALFSQINPATRKIDPRLRLAYLIFAEDYSKKAIKHLDAVIVDAETQGFQAAAARAKAFKKEIEDNPGGGPFDFLEDDPYDEEDDIWEDDEDEDDDIWEDEEDDESDEEMPHPMETLTEAILAGDDATIQRCRIALRKRGLSDLTIDLAIEVISEGKKPRTQTRKIPPKKPPFVDPLQENLF